MQIRINYMKCKSGKCSDSGICKAVAVCKHKVLRQEEYNYPPFFHPSRYCHECGICIKECPFAALELE
jgi:NAD-dependent dihydropyrimidine dehydrogenase PreA subunit